MRLCGMVAEMKGLMIYKFPGSSGFLRDAER